MMNNRYLFRGKQVDSGEWVYGGMDLERNGVSWIYDKDLPYGNEIAVFPETVGQCTGLCDKNGKLIFEGDILYDSDWECNGVVAWSNEHLSWMLRDGGAGEFLQEFITDEKTMKANSSVIIGNIHDNPEMLGNDSE